MILRETKFVVVIDREKNQDRLVRNDGWHLNFPGGTLLSEIAGLPFFMLLKTHEDAQSVEYTFVADHPSETRFIEAVMTGFMNAVGQCQRDGTPSETMKDFIRRVWKKRPGEVRYGSDEPGYRS
jgi:hypothetical protein